MNKHEISQAPSVDDEESPFFKEEGKQDLEVYQESRKTKINTTVTENGHNYRDGKTGRFKRLETETAKEYSYRLADEALAGTSYEDMEVDVLVDKARQARDNGDKTTQLNIEDEIQERLIKQAEMNGWSAEQTDAELQSVIDRIYGTESRPQPAAVPITPEPVVPIAPEAVAPSTTYWAGNNTFSYDPNRRSIPREVSSSNETSNKRVGRFRKAIAAVGLFGAGVLFGAQLHGHGNIHHDAMANSSAPVEETASSPSGEEEAPLYTVDEDVVAAVKDTPEEAVSNVSDQPAIETVSVVKDTAEEAIANVQDQADTTGAMSGVKDTPQEAVAEVQDTSTIEDNNDAVGEGEEGEEGEESGSTKIVPRTGTDESTPTGTEETEGAETEATQETLMVHEGDGFTDLIMQLRPDLTASQAYELYQYLIATYGPDNLIEGESVTAYQITEGPYAGQYGLDGTGALQFGAAPQEDIKNWQPKR
jgi:hypothetical protein